MKNDGESRRSWSLLGACLIAAAAMAATSTPLAFGDDEQQGRVSAVTDGHLLLNVESVEVTFRWTEETAVTLDGESAEISDLRAGDSASVVFQRAEDGILQAMSVDAVRR
jgi:hypothetical protein